MTDRIAAVILAAVAMCVTIGAAEAADPRAERGRYLVQIGGCNDCHTPGNFLGHRDTTRTLGGSDVGFSIPGMGVFVGPNLTPDKETGLGTWSDDEIAVAITTGKRPDGRILAPVMPWHDLAALTQADAKAIAAYLRTLPPVSNKVPGPFGADEEPTVFVMSVAPGKVFASQRGAK